MKFENFLLTICRPFIFHISGTLLFVLVVNFLTSFGFLFFEKKIKRFKKLNIVISLLAVVIGFYLRFSLAYFSIGNNDINAYHYVVGVVSQGKNIYALSHRYNYSPFWFLILLALDKSNSLFFKLPFHFLIKSFFIIVDLASLFVLYKISKLKKLFFSQVAVGFFFNPISILITGHHGQFENVAIFFILLGVYFYLKKGFKKLGWFLFLIGGVIKHIVFNQVLAVLNFFYQKKKKVILLFVLSVIIFLATFIPFWKQGKEGIISHVFMYRSQEGKYGITFLLEKISFLKQFSFYYRYLFIIFFFLFSFYYRGKNIIKTVLVNSLFFLAFTSGMADQYLILPLAFASLNRSAFLPIYTLFSSFYLFNSTAQLALEKYSFASNFLLWLVILFWFIKEYTKANEN